MTVQEFKKQIERGVWYHKYYYYCLAAALIITAIFFFGKAIIFLLNKESAFEITGFTLAGVCLFLTGTTAINLLIKKYEIKEFACNLPKEEKEAILKDMAESFNAKLSREDKDLWSFTYRSSWWSGSYKCYLSVSEKGILVSFIGNSNLNAGFVDLGKTNRIRSKVYHLLYKKINYTP